MSFQFSTPIDISIASQIKTPKGIYWSFNEEQDIVGIYKGNNNIEGDLNSLGEDIYRQIQELVLPKKNPATPIYTRRAKAAYYQRLRVKNPAKISLLNEKNKARYRFIKESQRLMSIEV